MGNGSTVYAPHDLQPRDSKPGSPTAEMPLGTGEKKGEPAPAHAVILAAEGPARKARDGMRSSGREESRAGAGSSGSAAAPYHTFFTRSRTPRSQRLRACAATERRGSNRRPPAPPYRGR